MVSDFNHTGGEARLWEYIDGTSSAEERAALEKLLVTDPAWQAKYNELLEVHELMHSSELEEPSMRFTKNVIDDIAKMQIAPAAKVYINKNIIRGISICFMLLIGVFLLYGVIQLDWKSADGSFLPAPIDIGVDKVNYGRFFNNTYMNIMLMVNVVLGLFLLDRYLSNKNKKYKRS